MNLEAAPCDASSSLYAQKKRKKHEKRHNSMENNHTDYGHREGTSSSMVNSPLDNDSPQEPPASNWAKGAFWVKTESSKATERLEGGVVPRVSTGSYSPTPWNLCPDLIAAN